MRVRRSLGLAALFALSALALSASEKPPIAMLVATETLGRGANGVVVGLSVAVAPEDRERLGERARVVTTLLDGDRVVDRQEAVAALEQDGTLLLYREWEPGRYELRVGIAALEGEARGLWIGEIRVTQTEQPFVAPEGAAVEAVALELTPPRRGGVRFLPPPDLGGLGALQLEVEVPEGTASVEFFRDGDSIGRRNRPPWTTSVPLGSVVRRIRVSAVARDQGGRFLGEDAIVLNNPTGQLGVEILLAPEASVRDGRRAITVAVTGADRLSEVKLVLDDRPLARWAECPCVTEVPVEALERATILSADAVDASGARGDAVITLEGAGSFVGSVRVELVELPVVVLDRAGAPVTGLGRDAFTVFEDEQPMSVEGFGTTADLPLSLAIAVDTSGSMLEVFPDVRTAVGGFAEELLEPGDEVALVTFAWSPEVVERWSSDFASVAVRLEPIVPEGGTSLHDAVVRSLELFRGRRGRQALALLTDGADTTSRTALASALRFAHTMRVPVFPIGLGVGKLDLAARRLLGQLAAETGGEMFTVKKVERLPEVYAEIGTLLRSQYLLWYASSSSRPRDQLRTIRVEVADPELEVRTIRGYYPGK